MNTVIPAYIQAHNLDMGPITELQSVTWGIHIHSVAGARTVQIEGIPSYGEDQVFLVVEDNSAYNR